MELLVVVAVLVVITTLAAVDLSGLIGRYRLNAAATELVSVVKECRAKAITENQPVALVLLASDSSAGTGPWRDNVGRYEQRTGAGASGNPAGLVMPRLDRGDDAVVALISDFLSRTR